jgi:hypothetical protein
MPTLSDETSMDTRGAGEPTADTQPYTHARAHTLADRQTTDRPTDRLTQAHARARAHTHTHTHTHGARTHTHTRTRSCNDIRVLARITLCTDLS